MRIKPLKPLIGVAAALVVAGSVAIGLPALTTQGADHLDAPLVQADGRIDINDVYAFQSPSNPNNTVLAMTVNPLAGVVSLTTFHPGAVYQLKVDNDDDDEADIAYRIEFEEPGPSGTQKLTLSRVTGADAEDDTGDGVQIAKGKTAGSGDSRRVNPLDGGGKLYAGLRDDPFFFDFGAFLDGLDFCSVNHPGTDFFAGVNVSAIVLEVPTEDLLDGRSDIGVWATTDTGGGQIERMGRPIINTALIPSVPAGSKDAFNATQPADDVADWTATVVASLEGLNGDADYSAVVAAILLPDILTYDTLVDALYLNGRGLADDVGDVTLNVVSMGAIPSDCVDANDVSFLNNFPYMALPH